MRPPDPKFKIGDRVITVRMPDGVMPAQHKLGTGGEVQTAEAWGDLAYQVEYHVHFDDGEAWFCDARDLDYETPLPSPEEALAGLSEILETETFGDYIERLADEFDPAMQFILGRMRKEEA